MVDNQLDLEKKVQNLETKIKEIQEENKRDFSKIQIQRHITAVVLLLVGGLVIALEGPTEKPSALVGSLILSGIVHLICLAL